VRQAYLPILFPSSHAANLAVLRNGDIVCVWFSGTWEGESDVAIVLSRLPHGHSQWSRPVVVDHLPGKSYQNPVLFQEPSSDRLWLLHTSQTANQGQGDAQVWSLLSGDNGMTWSKPSLLFATPGSFVRNPPLFSGDRWLLPVFYTPGAGLTGERALNYSAIKLSTDRGVTWKDCIVPGSQGLLVQPTLVLSPSGGYLAFFRSRKWDWIYKSTSADGCSWTSPMPTQLPNNNASVQALRLHNGHLVMTFDNSGPIVVDGKPHTGPRKPLSIALSEDGGKTWPWVRDLETGDTRSADWNTPPGHEEFSYPTVVEDARHTLYVAYSYQRLTVKVLAFDEAWIKAATKAGANPTVGTFQGDIR
jgi:predicted neuraminidase